MSAAVGATVVVTGAASGIGAAVMLALADIGTATIGVDLDRAGLERTVAAVTDAGGSARAVHLDVAATDAPEQLARTVDRVDGLVHCAGISRATPISAFDRHAFDQVLDVDLAAPVRLTAALLPALARSSAPRIVFVSSVQGAVTERGAAAYGAAKAALGSVTRTLALELAADGVLVNAVAPGFVDTPMARLPDGRPEHETDRWRRLYVDGGLLPLGRPAAPEEIAHAVLFLLDRRTTYITGHVLVVDGGLTTTF